MDLAGNFVDQQPQVRTLRREIALIGLQPGKLLQVPEHGRELSDRGLDQVKTILQLRVGDRLTEYELEQGFSGIQRQ
ncbi:hypothetical protein D3C81_1379800 [compost metagenome]